jgi:hypothetical protein
MSGICSTEKIHIFFMIDYYREIAPIFNKSTVVFKFYSLCHGLPFPLSPFSPVEPALFQNATK